MLDTCDSKLEGGGRGPSFFLKHICDRGVGARLEASREREGVVDVDSRISDEGP